MALAGLDEEFLHRSCVQLSAPLVDPSVLGTEQANAIRFARAHAGVHARELARALAWRVVDSADDELDQCVNEDRAGAWTVLTAVIAECGDEGSELCRTALADHLATLLPHLVAYRWYSSIRGMPMEGLGGSAANVVLNYDKVVPSSLINGYSTRSVDMQVVAAMSRRHRVLLDTWKRVWRPDLFRTVKEMVNRVLGTGNFLPPMSEELLLVPDRFRQSLWRLRRTAPRPSIALDLLRHYGWPMTPTPRENNNTIRAPQYLLPQTDAEIRKLDPAMHPTVLQWLKTLREKEGGCAGCDYWDHTEERCPCETPFWRTPADDSTARTHRALLATATGGAALPLLTYVEAAQILYKANLRLPLRVPEVLDAVTRLIRDEKPYEELLAAFDTVRGSVTGPRERHALWRHASYQLLPSKTVFAKPSDDAPSPCIHRIQNLFQGTRRFGEWTALSAAVDLLDRCFRRCDFGAVVLQQLDEVRATMSFFFCLVDGSLPASCNPATYARVPEEVEALAVYKDNLCRVCLQPLHGPLTCPQVRTEENAEYRRYSSGSSSTAIAAASVEEWDLQVARRVLEDNNCLILKYPAEAHRISDAMESIDRDDRPAKDFRKAELQLAVKLVHERKVPVCADCNVTGHTLRSCERRAYRALRQGNLQPVDVRLDPQALRGELRRYTREDAVFGELMDAMNLYGSGPELLPSAFLKAIKEMDDARVPLAAARYATETVQSFLLYSSSTDLLEHLRHIRSGRFPEVCVFCDSVHHRSDDCDRCHEDERAYLKELRVRGLTLWNYLLHRDAYDQLLPTDYIRGKESVLGLVEQFEKDYKPGGVGRTRFCKDNALPDLSQGTVLTNTYASISDAAPVVAMSVSGGHARKRDRETTAEVSAATAQESLLGDAGEGVEQGRPRVRHGQSHVDPYARVGEAEVGKRGSSPDLNDVADTPTAL